VIRPIVEGDGDERALPLLLYRLMADLGIYGVGVVRPIRQPRTVLVSESGFRRAVQLARIPPEVSAILVMFDMDDDCARDIVPNLHQWGAQEAPALPLGVALARREYEAWLLAAIESLRGRRRIRPDAAHAADPEAIRDAKGMLNRFMPARTPYRETTDQPALSTQFDLGQAYRRASSFRKLVRELCRILIDLGHQPVIPAEWMSV
jgi:hypothetical protein